MAEERKAREHTGEWLDAEQPLPVKAIKGGVLEPKVVGYLDPNITSMGGLIDLQNAKGVETKAVEKDGTVQVEVSVNSIILPKKRK